MKGWWCATLHKIRSEDRLVPILIAAGFAIVVVLMLLFISPWYGGEPGEVFRGLYIEATGAVMDIVVFGFILAGLTLWTTRSRERGLEIARQKELIDDFRKWNVDEARFRIAGALRRLNRLHCTEIDFTGLELSEFSFGWHEIESIEGSTFYDGSWGTVSRKNKVSLERVDFAKVDCRNVVFSKFNPFSGFGMRIRFATFKDCDFREAQLQGATFRGAHLEWSDEPPEEMGTLEDLGGRDMAFRQTYWPPFDGADLKGASFNEVLFRNADLRGALNVQDCSFAGAEGLDECLFDDEDVKRWVLEAVKRGT